MAQDQNFGEVEIEGVPTLEPVFILRAQDRLALPTMIQYAMMADQRGCPRQFVSSIETAIQRFEEWQEQNDTKLPD